MACLSFGGPGARLGPDKPVGPCVSGTRVPPATGATVTDPAALGANVVDPLPDGPVVPPLVVGVVVGATVIPLVLASVGVAVPPFIGVGACDPLPIGVEVACWSLDEGRGDTDGATAMTGASVSALAGAVVPVLATVGEPVRPLRREGAAVVPLEVELGKDVGAPAVMGDAVAPVAAGALVAPAAVVGDAVKPVTVGAMVTSAAVGAFVIPS